MTIETTMINLRSIFPAHEVREAGKMAALTASMEQDGWQGRPLLVIEYMDGYQAITGSHRIAAAEAAGIEEVPCVLVDREAFDAAGYSVSDLYDDDVTHGILLEIGDDNAADLMLTEINES
jgi:ParB-like nuclease domain